MCFWKKQRKNPLVIFSSEVSEGPPSLQSKWVRSLFVADTWWKLKSWNSFGSFIQNTCNHRKFTLNYISHVLTTKFHSDTNSDKKNNKKNIKRKHTKFRCQLLFSIIEKTDVFLKDPKRIHPSNRQPHPPWSGFPGPSSYPSQRRSTPRAAVPVDVAPDATGFNGGTWKFVWQKN